MEDLSTATYLGLDLSTQQLKAVVIDDNLVVLHETSIQFDNDLPEFRTYGGVIQKKEEPHVVVAPSLMWVKALDMILDKLRVCGVDFSKVVAISGCAQQHGTIYWGKGSQSRLQRLNPTKFLYEQFATSFSVTHSPVWMDSSTSKECSVLEEIVGGPHKLAEITGSRAYERFSGPQIAKIARTKPEAYCNTERILLVSNFLASLFLGDYAPIDWSDGSGMNLLNIHTKDWDDLLLETCASGLREKLGKPVSSCSDIGSISPYFVKRFDFKEKCRIIAFTGDTPESLVGMRLKEGDIACSLGTSDVLFLWLNEPKTVMAGHILCNPIDNQAYMGLLGSTNGSLTRERIRNEVAQDSWQIFNELLESTPRGNFGNFALYFDKQEILPFVIGDYRYNKANDEISRYSSKEVEVRALIEGQFVAKRAYAEDFGLVIGSNTRIIATGGASVNKAILQVLSDVFNSPVYISEAVNSAMMGAAYQAKYGLFHNNCSFDEITRCLPEPTPVCQPHDDAESIYKPMTIRYRKIVDQILKKKNEQKSKCK
ncbi:xylulose kinase isoform X1 [Camponotus floridanus]|uniref:xylulose kinase isoform X1 n=2 Tax=Camponotus floridanus TaxID=104421 RepID=UPI000DC66BAD|nr:xylulose kinase isoform X1 [Camponotus floridanus]XP_025268206.1 xylulose kinase isoform X1 [Camponotus floridanus]